MTNIFRKRDREYRLMIPETKLNVKVIGHEIGYSFSCFKPTTKLIRVKHIIIQIT